MPRMDDGPTDGPQGNELRTVWIELTADEARDLLESLQVWAEEGEDGVRDPAWHMHLGDDEGRELTMSIRLPDDPSTRTG